MLCTSGNGVNASHKARPTWTAQTGAEKLSIRIMRTLSERARHVAREPFLQLRIALSSRAISYS